MKSSTPSLVLATFALLSLLLTSAFAVDFEKDIQPILKGHCFKCHAGPKAANDGRPRYDKGHVQKIIGTGADHLVFPGKPEKSKLFELVSKNPSDSEAMPPPRRGKPLNTIQKAMIRKWIEEGAKLTASSSSPTSTVDKNKIHIWTNLEGKTLPAAFVSMDKNYVTLRRENDGKQIKYPIDKLNLKSRELAESLAD